MTDTIDHTFEELRRFPPSQHFSEQAVATESEHRDAAADRLGFWAHRARELLGWEKPFTRVLDWATPPVARGVDGGTLNASVNCLDRHVAAGNGDRIALHFEGEPGDSRSY